MPVDPEKIDDDSYEKTRKSVIWVSIVVIIESFLGIRVSESIPHLETAVEWKLSIVFLAIVIYLGFRLLQYTYKEQKFEKTADVLRRSEAKIKNDIIDKCRKDLVNKYVGGSIREGQIYIDSNTVEKEEDPETGERVFALKVNIRIDPDTAARNNIVQNDFEMMMYVEKRIKIGNIKNTKTLVNIFLPDWIHVRFPFILAAIAILVLTMKFFDTYPFAQSKFQLQGQSKAH